MKRSQSLSLSRNCANCHSIESAIDQSEHVDGQRVCTGVLMVKINDSRDSEPGSSPLPIYLLSEMALLQAQLFEDECPLIRSCPALNDIRIAEELTDLTIEVEDGARLHAHRIILASRIPSLRASLSSSTRKDILVLKWPSVPLSLANSLLHYLYTGQLEMTQSNVKGMISFARLAKLSVLENWGTKFLIKTMNTENLEPTWEFARSLDITILMNACLKRMKAQFESFVHSDLFVRLPADAVLTLLRSDDLAVGSEKQIFAAILRWTSASKEGEDEKLRLHVPAMLKEMQWQQTTARFREHLLNSHRIFQKIVECLRLMAQIVNWIDAADKTALPCPLNQHARLPQAIILFGVDKNAHSGSVLRFDSQLLNEERIADMDMRWSAFYSFVNGGVLGGGNTVEVFTAPEGSEELDNDLLAWTWTSKSPVETLQTIVGAVSVRI